MLPRACNTGYSIKKAIFNKTTALAGAFSSLAGAGLAAMIHHNNWFCRQGNAVISYALKSQCDVKGDPCYTSPTPMVSISTYVYRHNTHLELTCPSNSSATLINEIWKNATDTAYRIGWGGNDDASVKDSTWMIALPIAGLAVGVTIAACVVKCRHRRDPENPLHDALLDTPINVRIETPPAEEQSAGSSIYYVDPSEHGDEDSPPPVSAMPGKVWAGMWVNSEHKSRDGTISDKTLLRYTR